MGEAKRIFSVEAFNKAVQHIKEGKVLVGQPLNARDPTGCDWRILVVEPGQEGHKGDVNLGDGAYIKEVEELGDITFMNSREVSEFLKSVEKVVEGTSQTPHLLNSPGS
jgi:hypothetical protein